CSEDTPGQQTMARQEAAPAQPVEAMAAAEPGAATDLPEVIVLYGREELVPWLESENWWGPENHDVQLTVPHVIMTGFHPSWQKFSATLPVEVKKELFYRLMLPLVMHANEMVLNFRAGFEKAREEYAADGRVSPENLALVKRGAYLLPDMDEEDIAALTADHPEMQSMLDALMYRMDIVPAGLALGQAAYESGYGTSRFAIEGNSLFGQWTYGGDGIKPREQRTSSKGDHRIKAFEWPFDSVRGYFINLFSHPAYEDFRRLRADLRAAGKPMDSLVLADGLLRYSERGQEYVDSLKGIIRVNRLDIADDAVFRDEPLRFLMSEQSYEEATQMIERIEQAADSGELAVIIERMRLE
ncbi:MAG: glucosaminidase domain-containing protein, partial [Xanthomonadales bacterium]|nr:glucosaminidase domain-containing protein [Xanthomonadales bacterium]